MIHPTYNTWVLGFDPAHPLLRCYKLSSGPSIHGPIPAFCDISLATRSTYTYLATLSCQRVCFCLHTNSTVSPTHARVYDPMSIPRLLYKLLLTHSDYCNSTCLYLFILSSHHSFHSLRLNKPLPIFHQLGLSFVFFISVFILSCFTFYEFHLHNVSTLSWTFVFPPLSHDQFAVSSRITYFQCNVVYAFLKLVFLSL